MSLTLTVDATVMNWAIMAVLVLTVTIGFCLSNYRRPLFPRRKDGDA